MTEAIVAAWACIKVADLVVPLVALAAILVMVTASEAVSRLAQKVVRWPRNRFDR